MPLGDPLTKESTLEKYSLPKGTRVIPIVPNAVADQKAAGRSADALMGCAPLATEEQKSEAVSDRSHDGEYLFEGGVEALAI